MLIEMTSASETGPVPQRNEGAASKPTLSRHSTQLTLASSTASRRSAPIAGCRRWVSAAPSLAPVALLVNLLDARASRCRLLNRCHPSARCIEHAARRRSCRCTCDTYVHARMSEICVGGVWRALRNTLDGSCRRRASLLCLPPPQTIDGPLSGPRRPNSSETGRAPQTIPAPQPTGTQPLHMPPIAPVVGLDRFSIDVQSS